VTASPLTTTPEKLGELAYQTLRRMILHKALRSGGPVVEGRLAEELNISRTPMREALLRLEGEGLLARAGARSYSVRFVSAQEYFQAMKVRELLEAFRADNWLHRNGHLDSAEGRAITARLRQVFYPETDDWQGMVWERAIDVIRRPLRGVSQS